MKNLTELWLNNISYLGRKRTDWGELISLALMVAILVIAILLN